jgi:hypothetical protein
VIANGVPPRPEPHCSPCMLVNGVIPFGLNDHSHISKTQLDSRL